MIKNEYHLSKDGAKKTKESKEKFSEDAEEILGSLADGLAKHFGFLQGGMMIAIQNPDPANPTLKETDGDID